MSKNLATRILLVLTAVFIFGNVAHATVASIDHFAVYRNGTLFFEDGFSDGNPPPSTEATFPNGSPVGLFTSGTPSESGGRAIMDGALGPPIFPQLVTSTGTVIFTGAELARSQINRFLTSRSTDLSVGLRTDDDIVVMGLFDLVMPDLPSTNFGIGFTDAGGSGTRNDRLRLSVSLSSISQQQRVRFFRNDRSVTPGVVTVLGSDPTDFANSQILLRLRTDGLANSGSDSVFAEYAYINGPVDLSSGPNPAGVTFTSLGSTTAFDGEVWTRAEFRLFQRVDAFTFGKLVTGSPTTIAQTVTIDTGVTEINVLFNYRFDILTSGDLTIMLGTEVLGVIAAPPALDPNFSTASFSITDLTVIGNLIAASPVDLKFTLDGPTGLTVLLDNILVEGIIGFQNGNFATGDLSGWTATTSGQGSAGVLTITQVPEPSTLAIFALGLAGLGFMRRRRKLY